VNGWKQSAPPDEIKGRIGERRPLAGQGSVEIHRELMTAKDRQIMAAKLVSVLSLRMAIRLNFLQFAEEVLDEMPPFIDLGVDGKGM
jgi:hypothetical protein